MPAIEIPRPIDIVWILVFSFGCAAALTPLQLFPSELPGDDVTRLRCLGKSAPLVARSARGALVMSFGLAQILGAFRELGLLFVAVLLLLGYVAYALTRLTLNGAGPTLLRARRCATYAGQITFGIAIVAFIEGLAWHGRVGFALLAVTPILLAASRVSFVLNNAASELVALSGD